MPHIAAEVVQYAASHAGAPSSQPSVGNAGPGGTAPEAPNAAGQNGSGDSTSNNLFATDHGVWVYIQSLEEQFKQMSERVQNMETTERTQEQQIAYLTNQVTILRQLLDEKTEPAKKVD